jgi:hypothetical protein
MPIFPPWRMDIGKQLTGFNSFIIGNIESKKNIPKITLKEGITVFLPT